ncbi:Uncharacterised protein [Salmonella enterica subsp. enterica serovar Bovismorbificans]|uniref:Uncharacterized protein n=1 Tax=Salmonella enterica subsp. enterica serovar Bovismorbificans TaxID=58097 RepID=A0A655CRV6_SALET|nr:Uncharacterised protein [Salmonella enterica subsp. enterica serovar Bovismorbificans]
MRVITLGLFDTLNATFGVKDKLRLFALKRDPPALFTRFIQHFVEVVQLFNMLHQRRILFTQILIALQHMPDFGIGQTRMGAHHRFIEFVAGQPTFCRDGHFTDHTQPVNLRV